MKCAQGYFGTLLAITVSGLVVSGCVPMTPPANINPITGQPIQTFDPEAKRKAEDQLFANFKTAGKAVLIVPTISLDSLRINFDDNDAKAKFVRLRSGVTEWTNTSRPSSSIRVGYDTGNDDGAIEARDSYFQLVFGRTLYKIYLVDPGHYRISDVSYNLPRTSAFEAPGGRNISPSPLGYAMLKALSFDEFEHGKKWEDASYRNETVQEDYCTSVRVVNNECTSWGKSSYDVKRQTSEAGWTSSIKQQTVEARNVTVKLAREFASFDIASGEVVVIDGFYAEPPAATLRDKSCKQFDQESMRCELQQLTLVHIQGEVEQVKNSQNPADYHFPSIGQALKELTYRPIKIQARETDGNSVWGQSYTVKAN
ncbi:Lipoprotein [Pseudomonas cichorii]|uniref:Lipoprotein n=1 Tax=Pseudomonas cichorii TaxID=36746 RepID=A0A3M4LU41_PSECI|nr:hypothetical protein [Pseudomonas cichorii]RMQ44521.1 Lipoprotein [Pseudomonas cichorii]